MIDKDKVIQLAKDAGGTPYVNRHFPGETAMGFAPKALQDFAQSVYRQGLEDAAKVCEEQANGLTLVPLEAYRAFFLADSIRALKESTNG